MGLIRGGFVLFLGVLLFVAFLSLNTFATLSLSLQHGNVKDEILPLIYGFGDPASKISKAFGMGEFNFSQASDSAIAQMRMICQNTNITNYSFTYQGSNITISCATLQSGGKDAVLNETISGFIDSFYYKEYNCGFFDCLKEKQLPLFLVSQKAHDYWKGKFYLLLLVSLILVVLILLFMENRINAPIIIGILLALSAIPILKLSALFSFILGEPASLLIGIFFSGASRVFWISFILGLVLIALGFASKIMNFGFIKKLIQKKPEEKQNQTITQTTQPSKPKKKKK